MKHSTVFGVQMDTSVGSALVMVRNKKKSKQYIIVNVLISMSLISHWHSFINYKVIIAGILHNFIKCFSTMHYICYINWSITTEVVSTYLGYYY